MKVQSIVGSAYKPNFKSFRIEEPHKMYDSLPENIPPEREKDYKYRGVQKFLSKETMLIKRAKERTAGNSRFIEPLDYIVRTIKRQKDNPYNMVMYAEEYPNPKDDKVFLEVRNPKGVVMHKKELHNSVSVISTDVDRDYIISDFYAKMNLGEKVADMYRNRH